MRSTQCAKCQAMILPTFDFKINSVSASQSVLTAIFLLFKFEYSVLSKAITVRSFVVVADFPAESVR